MFRTGPAAKYEDLPSAGHEGGPPNFAAHWAGTPAPEYCEPVAQERLLVEREAELHALDTSIRSALAGQGRVLVLEGPAGIGKTSLLDEARRCAAADGMAVVTARSAVLEQDFGFGVVRQLFEPVLADADDQERRRLLSGAAGLAAPVVAPGDGSGGTGGPSTPTAAAHGLYWLTANLAERSPVLIAVDDVHWCDSPSLQFLVYLARRLGGMPVLLLAAVRTGDPLVDPPVFAELASGAAVQVIRPAPLSAEGVGRLVRLGLGPAAEVSFVEACRSASGGVPFLVGELVEALSADGVAPTAEAAAHVTDVGPRSVARATMRRLSRLSPSAGPVARAVAVLGRQVRLDRISGLVGVGDGEVRAAIDGLIAMDVLVPGPPPGFAHPLVHRSVYEDIPGAERAELHGRAARLLAGDGASLDEVAAHLLVSEPSGRPDVVATLRAAAGQAMARGAPQSAVAYLGRAVAEGPRADDQASLLRELGRAEAFGRDPRAAGHLEEARRLCDDPLTRARIGYELSEIYLLSGQWPARVSLLREALAELGDRDPDLAARIEAARAATEFYDPRFAPEFASRLPQMQALVDRGGPAPRGLALVIGAVGALRGMDDAYVLQMVTRGLDGGRLLEDEGSESLLMPQAIGALAALDELDAADAAVEGVFENARRRGSVMGYVAGSLYRLWIDAMRGSLATAEGHFRALVDLSLEHGLTFALPTAFWVGADVLLERPQLEDVAALVESIELEPAMAETGSGAWLLLSRSRLRHLQGHQEGAIADLRAAGAICDALEICNPIAARWRSPLALMLPAGARGEARALVAQELQQATAAGLARAQGVALRAAGLLEGGGGGTELLEESIRVLGRTDARLERARSLVELGAARRRANQRVGAREPLRAALELAHRCGAERLAERAMEELRLAGARPRRPTVSGPDALTPGEARVAQMAARGLTNREIAQDLFVTAKTVENQLGSTYRKLGVRSRHELRRALAVASPDDGT